MKIEMINVSDLIPYHNNPRNNEAAVEPVMNSIKEFGFRVPVLISETDEVIAGHTRILAAKRLEIEKVPCIKICDLTEEQIKAFRLADNKVSEFSNWDFELLEEELNSILELDMENFGFQAIDLSFDINHHGRCSRIYPYISSFFQQSQAGSYSCLRQMKHLTDFVNGRKALSIFIISI